jgi:hypothetical protein
MEFCYHQGFQRDNKDEVMCELGIIYYSVCGEYGEGSGNKGKGKGREKRKGEERKRRKKKRNVK